MRIQNHQLLLTLAIKFKERYEQLQASAMSSQSMPPQPTKKQKTQTLLRDVDSDDSDSDDISNDKASSAMWLAEYERYMNTNDIIPPGMSVVAWWGVRFLICYSSPIANLQFNQLNAPRYPIAASLARDYLAIMASSVSSERAFSSAGITLSKRRNRLKGDIVEALQCLKCMYRNDLIFREVVVAMEEEAELEDVDLELAVDADTVNDDFTWDQLLVDEENA
jgi:hypothetical protein